MQGQQPQLHELQFWPLSLRFKNEQMEAGYAGSRRPFLIRRMKYFSYIHIMTSSFFLLLLGATRQYQRSSFTSDVAFHSALVQGAGQCYVIFILVLFLIAARCFDGRGCWQTFSVEVFITSFVICTMSWMTFCSPTRFVKFQGYTLEEAFGDAYDSDSGILLIIDVFVTATHLGMPMRWFTMAPLELAAILIYALILLLIGSEEKMFHVMVNFSALLCLVVCSALSKRSAELDERRTFAAMISEKALRCEAEFQLSQVTSRHVTSIETRSEGRSGGGSECATDKSGGIFEPLFEKSVDKEEQLELVAAKGESEHWRIAREQVRLLSEEPLLGRGSFGSVQRGVFCGMLVAVKCPHLEVDAVRVPDLCNELRVLRHLRHPHIVTAHGAIILPKEQQIYLVLELIEGVTLMNFLLPQDPSMCPSVLARYQIMLGICRALLYMHTRAPRVVHGDLKGTNIMVETSIKRCAFPKVLDFGLSRVVSGQSRALGGTLAWMAPEVIDRAPVRCSADIYSFGRILAFTATGIPPLQHMNRRMIHRALRRKKLPMPTWPSTCPFKESCEPLVRACLGLQQELRPHVGQVHQELLALPRVLKGLAEQDSGGYLQEVQEIAAFMDGRELSISMQRSSKLPSLPEEEVLAEVLAEPTGTVTDPPSRSSSPSRSRRRRQRLPFPELDETSWGALELSLLSCLRRWNMHVSTACCNHHAYFKLGRKVCTIVLESDCTTKPQAALVAPSQCTACGILGVTGRSCDVCGHPCDSISRASI